jgi:hypothetical protein
MSFKVGKVTTVTRDVKVNVPIDDGFREEKIRVTMDIQSQSVEMEKKQALVAAKSEDVEGDWLKQTIKSVAGVEFDDGNAMSIADVLDIGYLRQPIVAEYYTVSQGLKRKN